MSNIGVNKMLTTAEFGQALDPALSADAVKKHCLRGKIKGKKVGERVDKNGKKRGGLWMISKAELRRFQRERKPPGRPPKE